MKQVSMFDSQAFTENDIHEALEPTLLKVLEENNILPHHLSFSRKKSYSSCVYKASQAKEEDDIRGGIIYRVRVRGESNYIAVKKRYSEQILAGKPTEIGADGYTKIWISSLDEVLEYAPLLSTILEDTIESAPKEFDCCSRYEQCSLERKCIHPNPEFSLNCSYKFKLKKGMIFYGSNRNID